jgi:hypothetical protein
MPGGGLIRLVECGEATSGLGVSESLGLRLERDVG